MGFGRLEMVLVISLPVTTICSQPDDVKSSAGIAAPETTRAFRTWDKTAGRWMHVWVSANGLFQVWEGRRVGKDWYMFKEFEINGDRYLSRQGILRVDESRAVRISERSDDGGQTWTVRFREELQRIR